MAGDLVQTDPAVLAVEGDIAHLFEPFGLQQFVRKFNGYDKEITRQVCNSWNLGRVEVDGLCFAFSPHLIAKVTSLPEGGELIHRTKMKQVEQLAKFLEGEESFYWLQSGIGRVPTQTLG